jgi:pyruvate dehydrogenase E1 component beta subunit
VLAAALNEIDPVIIFEYTSLLSMVGEIPSDAPPVDLIHAKIRKEGADISIITYGAAVYRSLEAAADLAKKGIDAEVVDLRMLRPIDEQTILDSVAKTGHALIVEDAWQSVSISSEISARIMEKGFYGLKAPVQRICGAEVPIPYPKHLEDACIPQKTDIINTVVKMLYPAAKPAE